MTTTQHGTRPLRADAVRNRARILDAARTEITAHGPEVAMETIATASGVAVGTLYRHFPTKADLVAAVLTEYVEQINARAEQALARAKSGASPLAMLVAFLHDLIEVSATNEAAKAAAPAMGASTDLDGERAATALAELITSGIAAGQLRADLTVADIHLLVSSAPLDQSSDVLARWRELMLPCLTVQSAQITLPAPAAD